MRTGQVCDLTQLPRNLHGDKEFVMKVQVRGWRLLAATLVMLNAFPLCSCHTFDTQHVGAQPFKHPGPSFPAAAIVVFVCKQVLVACL